MSPFTSPLLLLLLLCAAVQCTADVGQFLGEIRPTAFSYAPQGWAMCDGRLLPISENTALFSLLGVTYGGDGVTTFGLPNLQGATPAHRGGSFAQGAQMGSSSVTLQPANLPAHSHDVTDLGHAHTVSDPGHAHLLDDGGHSHSLYDPGHSHDLSDPGHSHAYSTHALSAAVGRNHQGSSGPKRTFQQQPTGTAYTGVVVNAAQTGVTVDNTQTTGVLVETNTTGASVETAQTDISVLPAGSSQAVPITPPTLVLNYIIALQGSFPPRQ
jgi:microcystin-dependent protein